ncbi:MAG TPA: ABC transporter permease [Rhizomicrobium sp.]
MNEAASVVLVVPEPSSKQRGVGRYVSVARRSAAPLAVIVAWWVSTSVGWVDPSVLPSPRSVAKAFVLLLTQDHLLYQLGVSLTRALCGALIGISAGLILGLVAGLWRLGEELYDTILQMLRTIPFLALVPLFIVWLGIGEVPKLLLIALATIFPMYLNIYSGVRNVDPKLIEAMRSFGLTGGRLIWEVIIPMTLPSLFTGLRYSLGISVLVLIAAEQINASAGLGYLLNNAQLYQQVDVILICIAIYALLGLLADLSVRFLEHYFMPWQTVSIAR